MIMYDGTLTQTRTDPALAWEIDESKMPEGFKGYVLRDFDAQEPDHDGQGYVIRVSDSHRRYDTMHVDSGDAAPSFDIREAFDRFGRDYDLIGRWLRMFHDVVSFDYLSRRDDIVFGVVTRQQADSWGCEPEYVEGAATDALETYRQWADGEVYGVIVVRQEDGAEGSLWGIYDAFPHHYLEGDVVTEIVEEINYVSV